MIRTFSEHSTHIHAITCTRSALPALLESNLTELTEINFVVKPNSEMRIAKVLSRPNSLGLDRLAIIIANCRKLRAVSIEGLDFDKGRAELYKFIKVLDMFPSITCFYLSTTRYPKERWNRVLRNDDKFVSEV